MSHKHLTLVIVGEGQSGVGRTSLVDWFTRAFGSDWLPAVGYGHAMLTTFNVDGVSHKLYFDDPSGEYEYRALLDRSLCKGEGFLIAYSITRRASFIYLADFHEKLLRIKNYSHVPIVLVGNKCDLESEREVTAAEGAELAKSFGCEFFEVSAITGINVEQSFSALVRELQHSKPANQETGTKKPNTGCTLC